MQDPAELLLRRMASRVLATHPEAQSLLSEAGHRRALAGHSATEATRAFAAMQAARIGYEELGHRLDPRRTRTVHFGVAIGLLAAIFAVLTVLDAITFAGVLTGWMTAAAAAAAAAWVGGAWLAALAVREGQRGLLAAIAAGTVTLGLLLTALHGDAAVPPRADRWFRFGVGAVAVLFIFALVAAAAMLIARTEPGSLLIARRRWHRCRAAYAAAVHTQRRDAEEEVVARQGWRTLARAQAHVPADGEPQIAE